MWTRRISSQTQEHPTPRDVFRALLSRMVEQGGISSWAHFEVVAEGGWFINLLRGKEPWIEVAYVNQQSLQLNLGVSKPKRPVPSIPEKWRPAGKWQWTVPLTDVEELTTWINDCLVVESGNPSYRVSGWMEGL
jgi:hypothetical protein